MAKRRNRKVLIVLLMVLVVAGGVVCYVGRLLTVRARPQVDYVAVINAKALTIPESQRAWPLYLEAAGMHTPAPDDPQYRMPYGIPPGDASWPAVRDWLDRHAETIALLKQAAGRPYLGVMCTAPSPFASTSPPAVAEHIPLRELGASRRLAWLLLADACRDVYEGRTDEGVATLLLVKNMARQWLNCPWILYQSIGASMSHAADQTLRRFLSEDTCRSWPAPMLHDLADGWARSLGPEDFAVNTEYEDIEFCDKVQRLFSDDGAGDGSLLFHDYATYRKERLRQSRRAKQLFPDWLFPGLADEFEGGEFDVSERLSCLRTTVAHAGRKKTLEKHAALRVEQQRLMALAPYDPVRRRAVDPFEHLKSDPALSREYAVIAQTTSVSLLEWDVFRKRDLMDHQATVVCIGLAAYRNEHGRYPKQCTDLGLAIPTDIYDGRPLKYRFEADDRVYLWSIGRDSVDHGGTPYTPTPRSQKKQPYDIVFFPVDTTSRSSPTHPATQPAK